MFTLSDRLEDEIEVGGETYRLNLSFDNVLSFFDLMDDDYLLDADKIEIAFYMFVETNEDFDFETKFKTVDVIVNKFILDLEDAGDAEEERRASGEQVSGTTRKYYDLKKDAQFIYASFMQEYGIDLIDMQGKLRWEKFKALLVGLRDDTKFREVIGIRAMELPKGKGMEEERRRIRKLKRIYALDQDQQAKENDLSNFFYKAIGGKENNGN